MKADDIQGSEPESKLRHSLIFTDQQPGLLHLIHPDPTSEGCIHLNVKINVKAAQKSSESQFQQKPQESGSQPMIMNTVPADSPTFLHGRPESISFEILLTKQPFDKDHKDSDDPEFLKEAIKAKVASVSIADGTRTEVQIRPVSVHTNKKEYRDDEFYVTANFDVNEFQRSATEKLTFAQLVINEK